MPLAVFAAGCSALVAGAMGAVLLSKYATGDAATKERMLLAPMIGAIDTCIATPEGSPSHPMDDLARSCGGPQGSAAALVESTLSTLQPQTGGQGRYPLGYTLPVPLLKLFHQNPHGQWEIDGRLINRLVRTIRDTERPLILYLFSTHFSADAPLEQVLAQDSRNLAQTRDGPLGQSSYYGAPLYNWSFASTQNELTERRVQAARAVLGTVCQLPAHDIAKVRGVTLLGELHHLFPNFEGGMGFAPPYRVTDYSPHSVTAFRSFLRQEFQSIEKFNRAMGADYASFDQVAPPSKDIRTEPLQRYTEHIDSFAQGTLPISGWAYVPHTEGSGPAWVHVFRNGVFVGKTPVNKGRQDVLKAKPEFGSADTGWRLDMDFRRLPAGMHRIDVFLEEAPGHLTPLGTRRIAIMDRAQTSPRELPQQPLPLSTTAVPSTLASIDMPVDESSYYYNPLVPLWHQFRGKQVVDYLRFFDDVVHESCLSKTPHYTHQIVPFANPSWDAHKFAIDASLREQNGIRLGVSLYGDASYGQAFGRWYRSTGRRGYGVTEFHPLKAMDAPTLQRTLEQHAARGAEFLSFFMEPRWEGKLVARGHNIFSFDPDNPQFGSDALYESMQQALRQGAANQPRP